MDQIIDDTESEGSPQQNFPERYLFNRSVSQKIQRLYITVFVAVAHKICGAGCQTATKCLLQLLVSNLMRSLKEPIYGLTVIGGFLALRFITDERSRYQLLLSVTITGPKQR